MLGQQTRLTVYRTLQDRQVGCPADDIDEQTRDLLATFDRVELGAGEAAAVVPQSWRHPHEPDIRTRLAASLTRASVPTLVVKGRCDYLDWQTATRYLDTFSGSELVYLDDAGHDVHVDEPAHVLAAVKAFLRGAPVAGRLDRPHQEPPGYQPALADPTARPATNVDTSVLADRRNADHLRRNP